MLGSFISIIGLLGVALYFSGWVYRWSYYRFFNLEITNLDLPLESFLLVPIQVFFGSIFATIITIVSIALLCILILTTLLLADRIKSIFQSITENHRCRSIRKLASYLNLPQSLIKELIVVIWILVFLFQLSNQRGLLDARKDFTNSESSLPVITLVVSENFALGRDLENPLSKNLNLSNFRIFGDIQRHTSLIGHEINNTKDENVWRLLNANNSYIYIFETVSKKSSRRIRPVVLEVPRNGSENLLILTSQATDTY